MLFRFFPADGCKKCEHVATDDECTSLLGYIRLFVPCDLLRHTTEMARSWHDTGLKGEGIRIWCARKSGDSRTVFHRVVFWQVVQIACLHSLEVFYLASRE